MSFHANSHNAILISRRRERNFFQLQLIAPMGIIIIAAIYAQSYAKIKVAVVYSAGNVYGNMNNKSVYSTDGSMHNVKNLLRTLICTNLRAFGR